MGASQSAQLVPSEDDEHEEEDQDYEHDHNVFNDDTRELGGDNLAKKVLKQEPEMLPCHASASPLTPQLSNMGTPRLGPSIKVWDPYNVLASPPRTFSSSCLDDHCGVTDVYLVSHGECHMNLRPDLVGGRCCEASLTPNGKRQARALAAFFKSKGIHFTAVYTSPLDRARATAISVCQEMSFSENQIQSSDALVEMSQGHWEGCQKSEIFTPETIRLMEKLQPDFCAPSGESLRQVEFRMVQFLNGIVMSSLPEKLRCDFSPPADQCSELRQGLSRTSSPHALITNSLIHNAGPCNCVPPPSPHMDSFHRQRKAGMSRKKSGKSRLQIVTSSTGDHEADDEMSPRQPPVMNHGSGSLLQDIINVRSIHSTSSSSSSSSPRPSPSCIGVFTHSVPIKCLITGLLGCSAVMSHKICIQDSSITVLQHSWKMGWQIKRLNDTAHFRLV